MMDCQFCGKKLGSVEDMQVHRINCDGMYGDCNSKFTEMDELQSHLVDCFDNTGEDQDRQVVPMSGAPIQKVVDEEVSINLKHVGYTLNMKTALAKKIESCDRRSYEFKMNNGNYVGKLSTAAFELFRGDIFRYLKESKEYIFRTTETKDRAGKTTQDTIRVRVNPDDKEFDFEKLPALYTINLYRTTDKVMVNGPCMKKFIDDDLPKMTSRIDNVSDMLVDANNQLRKCLLNTKSVSLPDMNVQTLKEIEGEKSLPEESGKEDVSVRRTRKKKSYEDYDTGTASRRKSSLSDVDVSSSGVREEQAWNVKPKYWEKYGTGEWSDSIAKECNKPKGCLKNCGKNNSRDMLCCDGCGHWCHFKCMDEMVDHNIDYICSLCENSMSNQVKDKVIEKEPVASGLLSVKEDCDLSEMKDIDSVTNEMKVYVEINEGAVQQIQYGDQCVTHDNELEINRRVQVSSNEEAFAMCLKELMTWYNEKNNIVATDQIIPVTSPKYTCEGGINEIYYFDKEKPVYGPERCTQVVIQNKNYKAIEVMNWKAGNDQIINAEYLLGSIKTGKDKDLFSMLIKQKNKICELKKENSMTVYPLAIMKHINNLAKNLEIKENRIKELSEELRKKKVEYQELKASKNVLTDNLKHSDAQNEKKSKELVVLQNLNSVLTKDLEEMKESFDQRNALQKAYDALKKEKDDLKIVAEANKGDVATINELRKSNDRLQKENKRLEQQVKDVGSRLDILQKVAGDVMDKEECVVVIDSEKEQLVCMECTKSNKKAENLLKEKCALNDQLLECKEKAEILDHFYKKVIETKDETIHECMQIYEENNVVEKNFKRLLLHFKAENELKNMKMLKTVIVGEKSEKTVKDSSTNTDLKENEISISKSSREDSDTTNGTEDKSKYSVKFCWFGSNCFRKSCKFDHEDTADPPNCRFRLRCTRPDCLFKHEDDCTNKMNCQHKSSCGKRHIEVVEENKASSASGSNMKYSKVESQEVYKTPHVAGKKIYNKPSVAEDNQRFENEEIDDYYCSHKDTYSGHNHYSDYHHVLPGQTVYPVKRLSQAQKNVGCR